MANNHATRGTERDSSIRRPPSVDPIDREARERTSTGQQIALIRGGASSSPPRLPQPPPDDDDLLSYGTNDWEQGSTDEAPNTPVSTAPPTTPTTTDNETRDTRLQTLLAQNALATTSSPEPGIPAPPYTPAPSYTGSEEASHSRSPSPILADEEPHRSDSTSDPHPTSGAPRPPVPSSPTADQIAMLSEQERTDAGLDITDYAYGDAEIPEPGSIPDISPISTQFGADYGLAQCTQHLQVVKTYLSRNRRILRVLDDTCGGDFATKWDHMMVTLDVLNATVPQIRSDERTHVETVESFIQDLILDAVVIHRNYHDITRADFKVNLTNHQTPIASFSDELATASGAIQKGKG